MTRISLALTLTLLATAALAAPSIPDILPAETFVAVGTPDRTALFEGFEHSPAYALWQDPSVQAFFDPLIDMATEALADPTGSRVVGLEELCDLFPGQICAGLLRISLINGNSDIAPFFAAETDRPQRVLEILEDLIEASGAEQQRDTYTVRDVTVARNTLHFARPTALPGEVGDEPGMELASAMQSVTLHTAVADGLVIISIDEPLDAVIHNLRGGGDGGLREGDSMRGTRTLAEDPDHQLFLHINPTVFDRFVREAGAENPHANLAALGIGDIRGMSLWANLGEEASDGWFAMTVAPEPLGFGRILRLSQPGEVPAVDWVPTEVISFSTDNFDLGAAYRELRSILRAVSPDIDEFITMGMMSARDSLGVDLEADLLMQLGSGLTSYSVANPAAETNMYAAPTSDVMILGLVDAARVQGMLQRLTQSPEGSANQMGLGAMLQASEYLGQTIYSPPPLFGGPMGAAGLPSFAVIGDSLVFASSGDEMRSVIAASQGQMEANIRQSPIWEEIEAHRLEGASAIGYQDDAAMMASMMSGLQQMAFLMMMNPQFSLPIDLTRVPGEEVFEAHLTHTITSSRTTPQGVLGHSHSPHHTE
ncbi:hypothetical protein JXA47_14790 [Candidatus Sumerlaeota bacterium]|nr:hypothetical protein [Candidatus Sumerlaeota bacterium]